MKKYIFLCGLFIVPASILLTDPYENSPRFPNAPRNRSQQQKQPQQPPPPPVQPTQPSQSQAQQQTPPAPPPPAPLPPKDCTTMTAAEQNFANQLKSANNKAAFCAIFTPEQRKEAIQLVGQLDESGNIMDADLAVQQVIKTTSVPMTQPKKRSSGACPVK